jgi:RNA polymerase sigma factor (sigma-70 family)
MKRFHWHYLRTLFAGLPAFDGDPVPDGELLERFGRGDSAAFELLVCRHAETVFGTCARICRDTHDAEDAFQATFLVFARKAKGIRRSQCLAGWLHRVAHRAATRAAMKRTKSQRREQSFAADPHAVAEGSTELQTILDAEINRLTDRYRLPVLLCYLQGLSTEDAAKQLGIPRGTVLSRLATARRKLTARLIRRGVTVPATTVGLFGFGMGQTVSASLLSIASRNISFPSTTTTAGLLAREILHMTAWKTTTAWATAFIAVAGLGGTVLAIAAGGKDGPPVVAKAPEKAPPEAPKAENAKPAEDQKAEAAKREQEAKAMAELEKREQLQHLTLIVDKLEKEAHDNRRRYADILLSAGHPEYDAKVLAEAISKIDAERLVAEDEKDQKIAGADTKLTQLNARRAVLSNRLLKQEAEQSDRNFRLELIKRDMNRVERLGNEFRTRLEYLKLGLSPSPAPTTDPAIQKLIEEVAELKLEVRKLAEAKK